MPQRNATPALTRARVAACLALAGAGGCYDGDKLVERARVRAISTRLEEVDLGVLRVTLPRDPATAQMTEVEVRLFGETPRSRLREVEAEVEKKAFLVNDRAISALRETTHQEMIDPDLKSLRARLLGAVNGALTEAPLESIGLADVRFLRF